MSVRSKIGSFNQSAVTGNQSVTGIGFSPKLVLFFWNHLTADGSSDHARMSIGYATNSTDQNSVWGGGKDGAIATDGWHDNTKCLTMLTESSSGLPSEVGMASFVSMDSDGFTVNWTVSDGSARIINFLVLGGESLRNFKVGTVTSAASATNQSFTGVGFKADALMFITYSPAQIVPGNTEVARFSVGYATDANSQAVSSWYLQTSTTQLGRATQSMARCVGVATQTINTNTVQASLVTIDTDGFTLKFDSSSSRLIMYLALRGGKYKVGSFNQATSVGNQEITGVGFRPKAIMFNSINTTSGLNQTSRGVYSMGVTDDQGNRASVWLGGDSETVPNSNSDLDRTRVLKMLTEGIPTLVAAADLSAMRDDGFMLNWLTVDGTAREILYFAIGDGNDDLYESGDAGTKKKVDSMNRQTTNVKEKVDSYGRGSTDFDKKLN